jgi:4-hydroxybenzoate polyprenyltransferase
LATGLWKFLDHLFLLRPVLMPPLWTILLLGYYQGRENLGNFGPLSRTFLFSTFLVGAIYILNQLRDVESDRINRKLFLIAEGYVSPRSAWAEAVILFLLACFGGFRVNQPLGFAFLFAALLGVAYSLPPTSLKDKPWGALLANMLGHGLLAFSFGWLTALPFFSFKLFRYSLPYGAAIGAVYLNTTLPDRKGDKIMGKRTLGVSWGRRRVVFLSTLFVLLAAGGGYLNRDLPLLASSLVVLPFFVRANFGKGMEVVVRATKVSILVLSGAVSVLFPWYLLLLILGYMGSRLYYQKRLDLAYPSLRGS